MRLEPIAQPPSLLIRAAYWMSRRRFGKVVAPLQVVYARVPALARVGHGMSQAMERKLSLDPGLRLLLQAHVAGLNGCGFCLDIGRAMAVEEHLDLAKFDALPEFETSPRFDERERAALRYLAEATRGVRVSDASFETLRKHFSEREIVEITWVGAVENYYNRLAIPLGLESDGLCAIAQRKSAS